MPADPYRIAGRPPGPLAQALGLIAALAVLAVSIVLGAFLIAAIVGLLFLVGFTAWLRLWWLSRKAARRPGQGEVIEAEYRVVREVRRPGPGDPG